MLKIRQITITAANRLYESALREDCKVMPIRMGGRVCQTPRELKGYGDIGCSYTYSGITHEGKGDWPDWVLEAKQLVEEATDTKFNTVIISRYRSGLDYISWHSDNEADIVPLSTIAGLSLGSTRDFKVRGEINETIRAKHGMIIAMEGDFQTRNQHSVPKRTGKNAVPVGCPFGGVRVSLTFRQMKVRTD